MYRWSANKGLNHSHSASGSNSNHKPCLQLLDTLNRKGEETTIWPNDLITDVNYQI